MECRELAGLVWWDSQPDRDHPSQDFNWPPEAGWTMFPSASFAEGLAPDGERESLEPVDGAIALDRRLLITADMQLFDSDALRAELNLEGGTTDLQLLTEGWARWGAGLLPKMVADFAIAVWDEQERTLTLARSALSDRPLAWTSFDDGIAFASDAGRLARLSPGGGTVDLTGLAAWIAGAIADCPERTSFANVAMVAPGCAVQFSDNGMRKWRFWDAGGFQPANWSDDEAARRLRSALQAGVAARISGVRSIAAHLSSGRDSSAVSMVAADQMRQRGKRLLALTAAPALGSAATCGGRLTDESDAASRLASTSNNIDHRIIRTERRELCGPMDLAHRHLAFPWGAPINYHWWDRSIQDAQISGCDVLLTGQCGNSGLSLGGPAALSDLWSDSPRAWARIALRLARRSPASVRQILNMTFGAQVPLPIYRLLRKMFGTRVVYAETEFLAGDLKQRVEATYARREEDPRPARSYRKWFSNWINSLDLANGRAPSGPVAVRDPTSDRRVIETAICLSPRQLASLPERRPIYDLAFSDLLGRPQDEPRGLQSADWFRAYDPQELRSALDRYAENRLVRDLIDVGAMRRELLNWPDQDEGLSDPALVRATAFLSVLAVASFLAVRFPTR